MSFEIAYKLGQLRAGLDGELAQKMDEIVELMKKEESAPKDTISIPFIQDGHQQKWNEPQIAERFTYTSTADGTAEAHLAADNQETFGVKL